MKKDYIENQKELIKKLKKLINKNLSNYRVIESILLFGSHANLQYTQESDLDLCLIFKEGIDRNTRNTKEKRIFDKILEIQREISKPIQCIFITPEQMESIDKNFLENVLAESILLYGSKNYENLIITHLNLYPFLFITFSLENLTQSSKSKFERRLYGYATKKDYKNKTYEYKKKGLVEILKGQKMGSGTLMIPEKNFHYLLSFFNKYDLEFSKYRVWLNEIT